MLQAALSTGLASEGADVVDLGVLPTPGVAWVSEARELPAVVISASHNPFADNGIKVFAAGGLKLSRSHRGGRRGRARPNPRPRHQGSPQCGGTRRRPPDQRSAGRRRLREPPGLARAGRGAHRAPTGGRQGQRRRLRAGGHRLRTAGRRGHRHRLRSGRDEHQRRLRFDRHRHAGRRRRGQPGRPGAGPRRRRRPPPGGGRQRPAGRRRRAPGPLRPGPGRAGPWPATPWWSRS